MTAKGRSSAGPILMTGTSVRTARGAGPSGGHLRMPQTSRRPVIAGSLILAASLVSSGAAVAQSPDASSAAAPAAPTGLEGSIAIRSEEHTSELQSQFHLVCRLLLEKKK